jgi:tetratricopeptide (TPR) repeat protein
MHRRFSLNVARVTAVCGLLAVAHPVPAADLAQGRRLADAGEYEAALAEADAGLRESFHRDDWHLLKAEMELTLGRWQAASTTLEQGLRRLGWNIRLRWLAREAYRRTDDDVSAERMLVEILRLTEAAPRQFSSDAENLVVLGQVALEVGVDPKEVLTAFFERAQSRTVFSKSAVLAIGRLALDKHDYKLAADTFREALKQRPEDADLLHGLAEALMGSDPPEAGVKLQLALTANPRHIPSLLLMADRQIDAEDYASSRRTLERVLDVNPQHDEAHAFLAAVAHLQHDREREQSHRTQALASWNRNPRVDFLIGRELSQKYRFEEGLAAQRRAMAFDPEYLPARRQAAEDLLRLGKVEEGWELAAAVYRDNQYDVAAYNLVTLRDEMQEFATLEDESFIVRMEAHEAQVYGERVLDLLNRAKAHLCEKYGLALTEKVAVEIFPDPADFEVRTFGMPGIPGFLGVCFGKVITANSPKSQSASPTSWEAVLWHEFCHVVTLQMTRNRMPRWLSEGISVYEERLADPRWGQPMTPRERQRILDGELTPIADLSSAFLNPEGPGGITFAYFQSSLVVEFLVETYGCEALLAVMADLAAGLPINETLPRHTAEMAQLEAEFIAFARSRAEALAPQVDWSTPDLAALLADENSVALLRDWINEHPHSLRGLTTFADQLIEKEQWDEARLTLERIIQLYPHYVGEESPLLKLAAIARALGETDAEHEALERYAAIDPDATEALLRLIELSRDRSDWEALERNAERLMGVNPLTKHPHEALAAAAEHRDDSAAAITAYRSLLALAPDDPSAIHYRLARHLAAVGEAQPAKRQVLMALEYAPRYRDAQRLLLELTREENTE